MATIDLEDAYFLVPVAPNHRKYLRFSFGRNLFQLNRLPFDFCTAFTKVMKPVTQCLRSGRVLSIIYLDDILLIGISREEYMANIQEMKELLESLGFWLNFDKCQLEPALQCTFLSFNLDSEEFCIKLINKRKDEITSRALELRRNLKYRQ